MAALEVWLKEATRHLSLDSGTQVRREIQDHYESARAAAMDGGASADEADRAAVHALGDARAANRQYRAVLLTTAEAQMLRNVNRESRLFCSRAWLRWALRAVPVPLLTAAVWFFYADAVGVAKVLLLAAMAMTALSVLPMLPIYTPGRARVFRILKWTLMVATVTLALPSSWLVACCLWVVAWPEWTRYSLRRKLPVEQWPKALYL